MKHTVSLEDLVLMGCDEENAACWLISRGKNKLTTVALKRVISEADKIGWTLAQAVEFSAGNGYIGFKAHWVKSEPVGFIEKHTDRSWANGLVKTQSVDFVELHTDKKWRDGMN